MFSTIRNSLQASMRASLNPYASEQGGARQVESGSGDGFTWGDGTTVEWSNE